METHLRCQGGRCVTKDIKNATATIPCNSKEFILKKNGSSKLKCSNKKNLSCIPLGCFPNIQPAPRYQQTKIQQLLPLNFACKGAVLAPPLVPRMRGLSLPAWKTCTRTWGSRAPSPVKKSLKKCVENTGGSRDLVFAEFV